MAEASRRSRAAREGNVGKGLEGEDSCTTRDKTLPNDRARQDIEHEDADDAARDGSNIISNETGNEMRTLSLMKNTVSQRESGLASRTEKEGLGLSGRAASFGKGRERPLIKHNLSGRQKWKYTFVVTFERISASTKSLFREGRMGWMFESTITIVGPTSRPTNVE